jgi:N utilization substance protein B
VTRSLRREARRIALDVLYEHEISGRPLAEVLGRYASQPGFEFAARLVGGVQENWSRLDEVISAYAEEWTIDRMPVIDRNLLRIGVFEILNLEDVPPAVTMNEAIELAKKYSTSDSSRFINGILARVALEMRPDGGVRRNEEK